MDASIIRSGIFVGGFSVMFCLESFFPSRPWQQSRFKRLLFHIGLVVFNILLIQLLAVASLLAWVGYVNDRQWGLAPLLGLGAVESIIISVIVLDMFMYWWHRFNHRVAFLWRFHKVHHVDTHVDVTTALRFHPGELFISVFVKAAWILVLGPGVLAFIIFESCISLASHFHHSNIDFPDSVENVIRKVFVTPRFHAAHHTVKRRTGDNNFSTIFIFWDMVFGSWRKPDYEEMKYLGLPKGRDSYLTVKATLLGPFSSRY